VAALTRGTRVLASAETWDLPKVSSSSGNG